MKVFISWSGERSKNVAEILRGWLPKVLQAVKPWMSDEDISTGTRWSAEIASELEISKAGIVCVTPENQHNPWLMFEAGALSKTLTETYVCPYLFDLSPSQLSGPISQFQATLSTKEGTFKIIQTLNKALGESQIINSEIEEIFDVWWPKLEEKLAAIGKGSSEEIAKRSKDEILEEILNNSREQMRREEIRLTAYQTRDEKIDTLMKMLEGWMKPLSQSSPILDSLKHKLMNISKNKDLLLKDGQDDPANIDVSLSSSRINELFEVVNKMPQTGNMADMMQKLKELSADSKKETTMLLNPEKIEK